MSVLKVVGDRERDRNREGEFVTYIEEWISKK
jgi:hypothetical protein